MEIEYKDFTPANMRYRFCPMCAGQLTGTRDIDGHSRPQCAGCGWVYYPRNLIGACVVITTPEGVVFLFPPGEPADAPAALPAGIAEFGETPEETAIREAREETGLEIEITRELGGYFYHSDYGPLLSFMYEARVVGGALRDGAEGPVAVFPEREFPTISPRRRGSLRALELYQALQSPGEGKQFHHRKLPDYSTLLAGRTPKDENGFKSDRLQIWYNISQKRWVDPAPHAHTESDECFVVLRGSLVVEVEGERVTVGPREFCCFPRGVYHSIVEAHPPYETFMIRAPSVEDKIYRDRPVDRETE